MDAIKCCTYCFNTIRFSFICENIQEETKFDIFDIECRNFESYKLKKEYEFIPKH